MKTRHQVSSLQQHCLNCWPSVKRYSVTSHNGSVTLQAKIFIGSRTFTSV